MLALKTEDYKNVIYAETRPINYTVAMRYKPGVASQGDIFDKFLRQIRWRVIRIFTRSEIVSKDRFYDNFV